MSEQNKANLIINYLPQTLTDEEFRSMFLSIGPLTSSKIIRDRITGYSYGFGFVEYTREDDAQRAIQTLNGLQLQNKKIKVAYARSGDNIKGSNLYIRNLPKGMTQSSLESLFRTHGSVVQARILTDPNTGHSKGVGFVLFDRKEEATAAINALDGKIPDGYSEPLNVKFAEDNKGKARPPPVVVLNTRGGGYSGGYGGGYGYGAGTNGDGGGYSDGPGPMRNQNRWSRYNPLHQGQQTPAQQTNLGEGGFVLFVYNIGQDTDERGLWQLFAPFGQIQKVNVMRDYGKGQSKGYGFVTMTNYHDATLAIQALNGYRFAGKALQVSFKAPRG